MCLEGRIEIAVIGGVMLGFGWKAVGRGCIYQSRPVVRNFSSNKREIGAAAHRWMDAKESACAGSAAVCTWICMCRCLFCTREKIV